MCTHDAEIYNTMDFCLIIQLMFDRPGQSESGGCYLLLRHCVVGCLWILTNYWPCSKRCLQKLCTPILCVNNRVHLSCTAVNWQEKLQHQALFRIEIVVLVCLLWRGSVSGTWVSGSEIASEARGQRNSGYSDLKSRSFTAESECYSRIIFIISGNIGLFMNDCYFLILVFKFFSLLRVLLKGLRPM